MGITLDRRAMALQLERAVRLAEDPRQELPTEWIERTEHIAGCPSRTYVAALGVALLAKATDVRIDALTVKRKVSANAYSMRGAAAVLARNASLYGYHLGVTGPEPLNNQPWFHGERIDQFRIEDREVEPYQNSLVRYLHELNGYDSARAAARARGVRPCPPAVRRRAGSRAVESREGGHAGARPAIDEHRGLHSLEPRGRSTRAGSRSRAARPRARRGAARRHQRPEAQGRRRAARCSFDLLLVEVKQKPVGSDTADHLAREAADASVDKALLVALAPDQQPLDRESIRASAEAAHGVLLLVCESVAELFTQIAIHSSLTATEVAERLPSAYLRRMQEHGVSEDGQRRWVDLCAGAERLC